MQGAKNPDAITVQTRMRNTCDLIQGKSRPAACIVLSEHSQDAQAMRSLCTTLSSLVVIKFIIVLLPMAPTSEYVRSGVQKAFWPCTGSPRGKLAVFYDLNLKQQVELHQHAMPMHHSSSFQPELLPPAMPQPESSPCVLKATF
jgi:hypothetical protein